MRFVAAAFLAAASLLIPATVAAGGLSGPAAGPKAKAGALDLPADANTQNAKSPFIQESFVYVPPPDVKVADPRFFPQALKYVPDKGDDSAGKLVPKLWGLLPAALAKSQASAAYVAGVHVQPAQAEPTATATSAPTPASTPAPRFSSAPVSVPPTPAASTSALAAPAAKPEPTATSAPPAVPAPKLAIEASATWGTLVEDIEDPRFYRGSYVWDAETRTLQRGTIGAAPAVASKAPTPSAFAPGTAAVLQARAGFPRRGRAMYYNPGIMEQVLAFRLEASHVAICPECIGYVALLDREDLNRKVWLEWEDGDIEGPFLCIDVAATQHVASLLERDWVVDVDHQTAMRRGMVHPMPVTVWDRKPSAYDASE